MFVVGTETDHVAPWQSVYKVGKLVRSKDFTFCLTSGGHNAGIISGPQHPKRRHRVLSTRAGTRLPSAAQYLEKVEPVQGSWWPTFAAWLAAHSTQTKVKPPQMGAPRKGLAPVCDAPGTCSSGSSTRTPTRDPTVRAPERCAAHLSWDGRGRSSRDRPRGWSVEPLAEPQRRDRKHHHQEHG